MYTVYIMNLRKSFMDRSISFMDINLRSSGACAESCRKTLPKVQPACVSGGEEEEDVVAIGEQVFASLTGSVVVEYFVKLDSFVGIVCSRKRLRHIIIELNKL